jgi:hypothetical protein
VLRREWLNYRLILVGFEALNDDLFDEHGADFARWRARGTMMRQALKLSLCDHRCRQFMDAS